MHQPRLLLFVVLVLLGSCDAGKNQNNHHIRAILTGADRVEAYRIDGRNYPPDPTPIAPGDPTIAGRAILAKGKDQGPELAVRLAEVLLDDATYAKTGPPCFWPGVAFRVFKGDDCVDVVICFKCRNFYLGPPTDKVVFETGVIGSSPAYGQLVRLAKEAFPDDNEIQTLKDN